MLTDYVLLLNVDIDFGLSFLQVETLITFNYILLNDIHILRYLLS